MLHEGAVKQERERETERDRDKGFVISQRYLFSPLFLTNDKTLLRAGVPTHPG